MLGTGPGEGKTVTVRDLLLREHIDVPVRESLIANMESGELVAAAEQLDADELADLAPDLPRAVKKSSPLLVRGNQPQRYEFTRHGAF